MLSLLVLALVDSVNPSAIVVTLTLLSTGRPRRHVALYIASVFATYLSFGSLTLLGIGSFLPPLGEVLRSRPGLIVQCTVGVGLFAFAWTAHPDPSPVTPKGTGTRATAIAVILLGIGVTLMEMPTAVPYLAAIALLTAEELPLQEWAPLIVAYNVIFVLPMCLLLAGHALLGNRIGAKYDTIRGRLEKGARTTTLWVLGLVGGWLVTTGLLEYAFRFGPLSR